MSAPSWVAELYNIEREEKYHRAQLRRLRAQKARPKQALYEYMARRGYDEYRGVPLKKVAPPRTAKRKPPRAKRADGVQLFRDIGVPDPVRFYDEFMQTQRAA